MPLHCASADTLLQRPFEAHHHDKLEKEITKAQPRYPVTQPPVTMPCLHAISSLLEKDTKKRIGAASFESFTQNPFFQDIDFVALERKQIPPIFIPSSEKTNFDATYDLEELLLEEAPLEARARRQKPRAQLKPDATDKEIRDDELHRMIETLFEPFDYTQAAFDPYVPIHLCPKLLGFSLAGGVTNIATCRATLAATEPPIETTHSADSADRDERCSNSKSTAGESITPPNGGSPPLHASPSPPVTGTGTVTNGDFFSAAGSHQQQHGGQQAKHSHDAHGRPRGGTRSASRGGGVQVVLGETGSWSDLADKSATLPAEGKQGADGLKGGPNNKASGMLGFLSRKGGRARSPKPREAGVLGKEGARVVVSGGR